MNVTIQDLIDRYNKETKYEYESILIRREDGRMKRFSDISNFTYEEGIAEFDSCVDLRDVIPDHIPKHSHIVSRCVIVEFVKNF